VPTAEQQRGAELIRHGFELYAAGDVEAVLELYDPEVVVTAPEFMNAGPYHGREGYLEWSEAWNEAWESIEFEVGRIEPVGERHLVAEVLTRARGGNSGIDVEVKAAWMYEMRNGRALYLEVMTSVENATEVGRRREADEAP
jgi:ketosteroid isomerase-like protein